MSSVFYYYNKCVSKKIVLGMVSSVMKVQSNTKAPKQ